MEKVYEIVLDKDCYPTEEKFWKVVASQIKILVENNYILTFEYEDYTYYRIRFSYSNKDFECPYPYWLTLEEREKLGKD